MILSCVGESIFTAHTRGQLPGRGSCLRRPSSWTPSMPRRTRGWVDLWEALRWSTDPQNLEHALALVQQALALDDSLPIAHKLLSQIYVVNSNMTKL